MNTIKEEFSKELNERTYSTHLSNGLTVYICKKEKQSKKIGMFGTKYGSVHNDFIDITTNERVKVPDGVAHYLEHKLFEQEGANALDLFSKEGISSNAYTSFDHTVYYFETADKFDLGLEMLIKLVRTPYFTKENVEKERGIIGQEISMYDDDPSFSVYFEALKNMYHVNPVNIDIAGTIESISHITKDILYTCYNTFYNLNNMFIVIIGDVDVEDTINKIEEHVKKYTRENRTNEIIKYTLNEPDSIVKDFSEKDMKLSMPLINIGFKEEIALKNDVVKMDILSQIVSEMYLAKNSDFYEKMYNKEMVSDYMYMFYEGAKEYSHLILTTESKCPKKAAEEIKKYVINLKNEKIDEELLEITKKQLLGEFIMKSEDPHNSYRRIIDTILNENDLYYSIELLKNVTVLDVKEFLNKLNEENCTVSIVK
ncbi:MAG: insulinase family protein [Clostridia bacterium]|nr:insulinase family protein [Clostridia bacterium]